MLQERGAHAQLAERTSDAARVVRVAKARSLSEDQVRTLVESQVKHPVIGIFGEPRVNVLSLNRALDAMAPG